MATGIYEYQSDLVRKNVAQGTALAVLTVLETRGLAVPDLIRERILHCTDLAEAERLLRRAVNAPSAPAIFDESPG
jgi:hypothetical protein